MEQQQTTLGDAAAEAGGRGTAGRTAAQRAADLKAAGQGAGKGVKIPVAYKPGTGSRMNIPGTKYAEVGVDASKATKGARLAQNALTKYPNSAKAQQLITKGATTAASKGAARTVAKTLGKAVPFAGAAISIADAGYRASQGDYAGALMSGLTAVPGPVGWTALGAQIVYDTARANPTSSIRGRSGAKRSLAKEEKEYNSYQEYVDKVKEVIDREKVNLGKDEDLLNALKSELGLHDKLSDKDKEYLVDLFDNSEDVNPEEDLGLNKIIKKLSSGEKKVSKSSLPRLPKRTNKDSSVNESHTSDVIKNIKKPYTIKEVKQEKLKGYRPKTYGSLHTQYDTLMQKAENPASFKQMDETAWTKHDKYYNERLSQERKNEVLDHLGTGDHYWDLICETGKKSREKGLQEKYGDYTLVRKEELAGDTLLFLVDENGKKESILQSEYSDRIARQIEEPLWEQETLNAPNDPLIKRVRNKLATQIDYPDKPSPMGYPDGATPQQVAGWHPEYGKRAAYYNALDPQSADAMPLTGDPETDVKVDAQKTPLKKKSKKELKAEARLIQSDWKNEIQIPEKKLKEEVPTFRKLLDVTKERGVVSEKMTSSGMFVTSTLDPTGDDINVDISASSLRYNIGDAVVADGAIKFGEVEPNGYSSNWWNQMAGTNYVRTTTVPGEKQNTHVSFNVDVGTGIDAPLPNHPLVVEYQMQTSTGFNAGYGTLGNITTSGIHSFELPEFHEYFEISFNLEVQGTYLRQYEADYQRRQFVGSNIYGMTITEDDTINSLGPARMLRVILDHPGPYDDSASSSMHVFLHHTRTNGQTVYQSLNAMPSGETGGHTGSDRLYLYNLIRSQYAHLKDRYAKTYTINSLGMTRRTPITVFKSLDDPDANVFIRMGGLENLSPEERRKKLADMLAAGDEYILNYLGIDPSTARPGNDEVAGPGYIDSDDAFDNPYYDEPFQDPGDLDDSDDESTWDYAKGDGDTEVAGTNWDLYNWMNKTYGLPARVEETKSHKT